jgi:hypothetical protein
MNNQSSQNQTRPINAFLRTKPMLNQLIGLVFLQEMQCNIFKDEYCSLSNGTVLMMDAKESGPIECQVIQMDTKQNKTQYLAIQIT